MDGVARELSAELYALPPGRFALLDAARAPGVLGLLAGRAERRGSLFDGARGRDLAPFGPWLVELGPDRGLVDALRDHGWGDAWGVLLTSAADFDALRRHLRRFLIVRTDGLRKLYFRFYDPRVLRPFLAACTPAELGAFFGPVARWVVETPDGDGAIRYEREPEGLRAERVAIKPRR